MAWQGDEKITDVIQKRSIIPALWDRSTLSKALDLGFKVVFTLKESIKTISLFKDFDLFVFVDIDMMNGVKPDDDGLEFLRNIGIKGIITVKPKVVSSAKKLGLSTILRIFALDSRAVEKGIEQCENACPDYLEVLPGMTAPKFMNRFRRYTGRRPPKTISAGLVDSVEEVEWLFNEGVYAISTSNEKLWEWFAKLRPA